MDLNDIQLFNPDELPSHLYHYTSQHGLFEIIRSKSIWATDIHYLNDSSEYRHAMNIWEKVVKSRLSLFKDEADDKGVIEEIEKDFLEIILPVFDKNNENTTTYVSSFSEKSDLLSQWRGYSQISNGFCIGFDTLKLKEKMNKDQFMLYKCIYEGQEQEKILNQIIDKLRFDVRNYQPGESDYDPDVTEYIVQTINKKEKYLNKVKFQAILALTAPLIKNKSFREEKEWRFCYFPSTKSPSKIKPLFREGKSFIIPYHPIPLSDNNEGPIDSIIIGPTPHKALSQKSLGKFLETNNIYDIKIEYSEIPFRDC